MTDVLAAARFFAVVSPLSPLMTATFGVVAVVTGLALVVDPSRGVAAVTPVLVLQLFAASSGFAAPARRGHYDLLLTRGISWWQAAVVHWAMSTLPGLCAWIALGIAQRVASAGARADIFAGGTCAAMFVASALPWALTVSLPRFAGAIGWLLVMVITAALAPAASPHVFDPAFGEENRALQAVWFLVYPAAMLGREFSAATAVTLLPAVMLAAGAMAVAVWWIHRMDVRLESAQ
jgi:hypothetical protein